MIEDVSIYVNNNIIANIGPIQWTSVYGPLTSKVTSPLQCGQSCSVPNYVSQYKEHDS